MPDRWRVAVVDSGIRPGVSGLEPTAARRFVDNGREVHHEPVSDDLSGHGTTVAGLICGPAVELLVAQVLDDRGRATPAAVAAAILWSVSSGAHLVHMSLGLREHREVLGTAVDAALRAGRIVVASAPARGACTYPARYSGVIRATGDARCQKDEISELSNDQADFGACPGSGGASIGAAHFSRFLVRHVPPGTGVMDVRAQLSGLARYHGAERRSQSIA